MRTAAAAAAALLATSTAHAAPKLAPHIAPFVEKGRAWTYDLALTTWGDPDMKTKHTARESITCTVVEVVARKAATLSHVTCDREPPFKLRVAAWYAATPAGLWGVARYDDAAPTDEELADALKEPPLIAARPRAFRKVTKMHGPDPKHDDFVEGIRRAGTAWCAYTDSSNADVDGGKVERCFAPGVGPASGLDDTGGELNRFEWKLHR